MIAFADVMWSMFVTIYEILLSLLFFSLTSWGVYAIMYMKPSED